MRKAIWMFFVTVLAALTIGLLAAGTAEVKKLSTYGWAGRVGDISLIVDSDAARLRGGEKYIPLLLWLGHSERKTIYANRTSFTLTDPKGAKVNLPTAEEVATGYDRNLTSADYKYIRKIDYGGSRFYSCVPIERVCFFPNLSAPPNILYDNVELPNRTYCRFLLYFPNPAGKAEGNYTLTYDDPKSQTHIEVPFAVTWQK